MTRPAPVATLFAPRRRAARLARAVVVLSALATVPALAVGCAEGDYGGPLPRRPAGEGGAPPAPAPLVPPERSN